VKDGLVERPEDWPGIKFLPEDFGRTITVRRPENAFFGGRRPDDWEPTFAPARAALRRARLVEQRRQRGKGRLYRLVRPGARPPKERAPRPERRDRRRLPETATFTIAVPPGYDHLTLDEVRVHFRRLLDARVARIHRERQEQGLTRYMGVAAILAQDPRESAGDTFPTFGRNPRIACVDGARRCALLAGLQAWRMSHRTALLAWRAGQRDVVFPHGTYGMHVFHAARVAAATGPPVMD
jgi:putative transposase